jgi:hypothetical protein
MALLGYYSFDKILKTLRDWEIIITNINNIANEQQSINEDINIELLNSQQRDNIQIKLMFI